MRCQNIYLDFDSWTKGGKLLPIECKNDGAEYRLGSGKGKVKVYCPSCAAKNGASRVGSKKNNERIEMAPPSLCSIVEKDGILSIMSDLRADLADEKGELKIFRAGLTKNEAEFYLKQEIEKRTKSTTTA